jgi:uncharacterized phage infection (PIP) family protein YhgE
MKSALKRIIGILLILTAIGGLVFSAFGLVNVWHLKPNATSSLLKGLDVLSNTLDTTAQGLVVAQESLDGAIDSMIAMQSTVKTIADTMQTTEPMVTSFAKLMGEDMPNTITATQTSLVTAQASAQVIDTVLNALSIIPGLDYKPEVPLHTALGQVSDSLNSLPDTFAEIETSLTDVQHNLKKIQIDLTLLADSIHQIETSMTQARSVINQYQISVANVQKELARLKTNLPGMVNGLVLALTVFFVWMAVAQLGLLTQGWELIHKKGEETVLPEATAQS